MYIFLCNITVLNFPWLLSFIKFHLCTDWDLSNKNYAQQWCRESKTSVILFHILGKILLCQCSKLTSMVISRLWFGMLVQNALRMYWDPFNCYVNCLHMWLLSVISLYLYVLVSKYVSIMLDFAGHPWMT